MEINKQVEPIVSMILKQNQTQLDVILEGNAAILSEMYSSKELGDQKTGIMDEFKTHMISEHRGNLDDKCGTCKGLRIDIQTLASAAKTRTAKEKKLNDQSK